MNDEYAAYYSRCLNSGHFVLFHPEQITLEHASVPDALDANCPVCRYDLFHRAWRAILSLSIWGAQ
jgi:hypothetical protein